jgi:hypothetical protein
MSYTYNNNRVAFARHGDVSRAFIPSGHFGPTVQETIDTIEPWECGEDPVRTFNLPAQIGARVVALAASEVPVWGINPYHKTRITKPSPFINLHPEDSRKYTRIATLELSGTITQPVLENVYPGEPMMPLPWMNTAKRVKGGKLACREYWKKHAFILRDLHWPKELWEGAPQWYRDA